MSPQRFQAPRGTSDILPSEQKYWRLFEDKASELADIFGYERIDTPTFEDADLFVRGTGESTDIIEKETYTFEDRGGDSITLRPEGTPPVCRAYLQSGMHNLPQPIRLYYHGSFFRYDRPQAGRYRELHQFGIEIIGDSSAYADVEVIEVAWRLLKSLEIHDATILLNSIGDQQCRPDYIENLQSYYRSRANMLVHEDCKRRLETNPLRLLDCKEDTCQTLIADSPGAIDYLCKDCMAHWDSLVSHLERLDIAFEIDKRLVRGLDYYTRTVFEMVPPIEGQQSTVVAGGRYDGLMEDLGGQPTPAIGFGMGIDRVITNMKRLEVSPPQKVHRTKIVVAHIGAAALKTGLTLSSNLRINGISAILAPAERSLKSQMKYASAVDATHVVIIGDVELGRGVFVVRDLVKSKQIEVSSEVALEHLRTL